MMTDKPIGFEFTDFRGEVSVGPNNVTPPPYSFRYLIMGPTGAGKSSFIQALAGDSKNLYIAKDQLAGYTQQVTSYKVAGFAYRNLSGTLPIYLVDTPGFSNADISEWEVMVLVRQWLEYYNKSYWMSGILYFTPITDTRLRGSKQRTIEMLREFLKPVYPGSIVCVTTMWDTLSNESAKQRAEYNFTQLQDGPFRGDKTVRFMNTQTSALQILNKSINLSIIQPFSQPFSPSVSRHLYGDLCSRIETLLFEKENMDSEMSLLETQADFTLLSILEHNQKENQDTLIKFIRQLAAPSQLSPPEGFIHASHHLRKMIAAEVLPMDNQLEHPHTEWAQEPEITQDGRSDEPAVPIKTSTQTSDQRSSLKGLIRRLFYVLKRAVVI